MIKLDTGTELPENFILTKEFKDIVEILIRAGINNEKNLNLYLNKIFK